MFNSIERSLDSEGAVPVAPRKGKYSPLRHRPHNYPIRRMTVVHIKPMRLAEGGDVNEEEGGVFDGPNVPDPGDLREPDEDLSEPDQQMKQVVVEAMLALRGEHPDPEKAIRQFIDAFGEDEYRELRSMVLGGGPDQAGAGDESETGAGGEDGSGMQVGGLLKGPGAGQDDKIEATTPNGRTVLLSDGEYVIDAPTVAALGDGSTSAGARRLDAFRKAVRTQAYGHERQANAMKKGGRAILEALKQ